MNMELSSILSRFAEGLVSVDKHTTTVSANQRTGEIYAPGVKTLREPRFVEELLKWWLETYPGDFNPRNYAHREIPYPDVARAKCDLVISTNGLHNGLPEWAIEVKHIALVGNNGKNNDYGVQKLLSPYLKDRSLIHDIHRMQKHPIAKHHAVIGYCFEYDFESCKTALKKHPYQDETIDNIMKVCKSNDSEKGVLSVMPMVGFANEIFTNLGLVKPLLVENFANAWRHPCGGKGQIFGWEIK